MLFKLLHWNLASLGLKFGEDGPDAPGWPDGLDQDIIVPLSNKAHAGESNGS